MSKPVDSNIEQARGRLTHAMGLSGKWLCRCALVPFSYPHGTYHVHAGCLPCRGAHCYRSFRRA